MAPTFIHCTHWPRVVFINYVLTAYVRSRAAFFSVLLSLKKSMVHIYPSILHSITVYFMMKQIYVEKKALCMRLRCCSWILFMGVMPFLRIFIHKKQFCPHREGISEERERERKKILLLLCILYMFTCLFRGHRVTTTCSRISLSVLDQIWMLYYILHPQIWLQTIMESMSHSCLTEEVNVSCNVHSLQHHCSWKFLYPDCKMSAMFINSHSMYKSLP